MYVLIVESACDTDLKDLGFDSWMEDEGNELAVVATGTKEYLESIVASWETRIEPLQFYPDLTVYKMRLGNGGFAEVCFPGIFHVGQEPK